MSTFDKRLNAVRPDLADTRLQGTYEAERFVDGVPAQCVVPVAGVFRAPAFDAMQVTQVLLGETVLVFERAGGWAWVQLQSDDYVGYVSEAVLGDVGPATAYRVTVPLTHLYPKPDIKAQLAVAIPLNSALCVTSTVGDFHVLNSGQHVFAAHAAAPASDFVSVAEQYLHVPYLWGGKTWLGIDCSGLVQVALQASGVKAPRDSDMQEQELGVIVADEPFKRGDMVFWKGHVGIMRDEMTLLHANGHHMMVVSEDLSVAMARIAAKGSAVTAVKRVQ